MRAFRWIAAAAILGFSVAATYSLAWRPFRCNVLKKRAEAVAPKLWNDRGRLTVALTARQTIHDLQECIGACPTDADLYVILGYYDAVIGRVQHATTMYREGLRYRRRPEIFFDLGMLQLDMKERDAAIASLTQACNFNRFLSDGIDDPLVRDAVLRRVAAERERGAANPN